MTPLIDATEMYLRTVYELEEEGIVPLRARLVERLHLSAPSVSETVGRLEADGLLAMADDRTLTLTARGRSIAQSVMRKHRLAERLLTDVIGLELEHVHDEACRWEHVISDRVEDRLVELLSSPQTSPFGNPIPGSDGALERPEASSLWVAARTGGATTIRSVSEKLQVDAAAVRLLQEHGLGPGVEVTVGQRDGGVLVEQDGHQVVVPRRQAEFVYVDAL